MSFMAKSEDFSNLTHRNLLSGTVISLPVQEITALG
jgi:hypothetical protein